MTGETLLQGRQSIVGKFRRNAIQKIAFPIEKPNPKLICDGLISLTLLKAGFWKGKKAGKSVLY